MLINLWVRDNFTGEVHQVGTNHHDSIVFLDGEVVYENIQNGVGTFCGGYSFVEPPDIDGYISVTPEELMLNEAYVDERIYDFMKKHKKSMSNATEKANYNRRIFIALKKIRKRIKYPFIS